ncbi:hypothetical protein HKCCE4037_10250 [Rhodobacterales bacterium HKCCE4037]|nr:hypothetical protein [Rhodobacterales bacterium HKCCE4037]
MRIVLFFVTFVALLIGLPDLLDGNPREALIPLGVAAVAGVFFWRNLRDPEVTRKMGRKARTAFTAWPGDGLDGPGTFARVADFRGNAWDVVLVRTPLQGDFKSYGEYFGGWLWLGEDGLPARVKIKYLRTWRVFDVRGAVRVKET